MPRSYLPTCLALKMPEILLVLAVAGIAGALVAALPPRSAGALRRAASCCWSLAAVAAGRHHGGDAAGHVQRHPPFRLRGAAACRARRACRRLDASNGCTTAWPPAARSRRAAVLIGRLVPAGDRDGPSCIPINTRISTMLAGGVRAADERYMLDYWGLAFKQASEELRARLTERRKSPRRKRRWRIAVCGPHRAGAGGARPGLPADLGSEGRRFRADARRILLRGARRARAGRDRARRRGVRPRLRYPRPLRADGPVQQCLAVSQTIGAVMPPRAFVFDAYGTLFDVHAAIARHRAAAGPDADRLSELWRTKQLEYTWTLTLAGRLRGFLDADRARARLCAGAVSRGRSWRSGRSCSTPI